MKFCIHRGSDQIGGSCVELEHGGERILVDLGLPLDQEFDTADLPPIEGSERSNSKILAVLLSHSHRDHWGLLPKLPLPIDVYLGRKALSMMTAARPFVPGGYVPERAVTYQDRVPFNVGPFEVTPYLADHSGFDAYSLLIRAGGKTILYSGDIRSHGRKAALFQKFLADAPAPVDVLLMEGSSLGRLPRERRFETETDIEQRLVEVLSATEGMLVVACSVQNIDRVVSVYRAAKRSGRQLLVDAYGAEILKATDTASIPKPSGDWDDVKVYIPQFQRRLLVRNGIAHLVDSYKGRRIFPEKLSGQASKSVMIVRPWMLTDLQEVGALEGARAVWSQWEGYLTSEPGVAFTEKCKALDIPLETIHTSGHADIHALQQYAAAVNPVRLVPIHTFFPSQFSELFANVELSPDGNWVEI
ncbi:MBL fold metallo-hydrolase [Mesorhizobium sp. M2D.F.Ca.ET.185.01.1.1]|uniref:MBL fold metallo-hydrolase n=1 Tax=unclassified Mesorhizobium TaxID=325217 RepID=UPI000FCB30F7|nr:MULTISPECIES: MBL fold metallo-hydrolase [unclassified Mesorhizobium]TGP74338.1 MBL fold metallo-hydrolase [bacterium M00.F.Ca.ET.227.01.1.1]TGP85024.1 MBL fold metallo-hydrolase [bacterium M00.F.Ca.ET.221.01.1.1]TGP89107.1 MBL fold metallo-hydrolase [bacterium M00.F.Ca.ET.222.01.1.1]TGU12835.1 MBL fold metallo-hydrolase [bacterium M00.F.Ca.ET.163.01.1.1]TGU21262.1 MBL fold metallo-hydrolase [bacterium M00.F.Ca.ET.156.01.1.1]TGU43659.1 MBL fold metallo-hydrolase [bacterium M00.F.Ca.ET.146.